MAKSLNIYCSKNNRTVDVIIYDFIPFIFYNKYTADQISNYLNDNADIWDLLPNIVDKSILRLYPYSESSIQPTSGRITRVPIMIIPCIRSVHATAKKPPIKV